MEQNPTAAAFTASAPQGMAAPRGTDPRAGSCGAQGLRARRG